jgi:isoleucyl-tRNA synthetase
VDDISYWPTRHLPHAGAEVLEMLSRLLAPFVPYLAEAIHRQISGHIVESVHLTDWPTLDSTRTDPALLAHIDQVWRLAALGQTARAQAGVDPNRSLRRALISLLSGDTPELEELAPFKDLLAEALGVAQVEFTPDAATRAVWQLDLYPGQTVERSVAQQEIETALANLGPVEAASLASQIWQGLSVSVEASGQAITLLPDEVRVSVQPQPGLATAADAKFVIALTVG